RKTDILEYGYVPTGEAHELGIPAPPKTGELEARGKLSTPGRLCYLVGSETGCRLLSLGELLQREGVTHISQGFVAGKADCLVHARLKLLFAIKNRVVPIRVAQDFWDILAPTFSARHRRVLQELVAHKEAVSARERFVFGIQFCCVHLNE